MVGTIFWLPETIRRTKTISDQLQHHNSRWILHQEKKDTLGILAFDTAKSISRLLSLYRSLSDEDIQRLRKDVMKSKGITYLTSEDDGFLLTLACAERLEDLDRLASAVARLGQKCSDYGLVRFDQVYRDLKKGYVDMDKLAYGSKEIEKYIDKMEKLTNSTGKLYDEIESLSELEASERKLSEWRRSDNYNNSNKNNNNNMQQNGANYDLFDQKIGQQRRLVRHLKETSLWNQPHDKIVGLMAKIVCVLYARICALFGPYISVLPSKKSKKMIRMSKNNELVRKLFSDPCSSPQISMSGPLLHSSTPRVPLVRFLSRDSNVFPTQHSVQHSNRVFQAAPSSSVGGSGLAMRYANVILLAEKYLYSESLIGDQARHNLYNMLPASLKAYVRSKLKMAWRETEAEGEGGDELAQGWREAIEGILEWLAPMARDTVSWQSERNFMEKQRFDAKPSVLLLQTLHYADLEKTEAAIAEVLVGLSCIYWYENRRLSCVDIC